MKADQATLHEFLDTSRQYRIPIYQRTYSWTEEQCDVLFNDILRIGSADEDAKHFIGSIVYIEEGISQATREAPFVVIDGQQRLTTIILLVEAIARFLESNSFDPEGYSPESLRNDFLFNAKYQTKKDLYHKLILTKTDQDTLLDIINKAEDRTPDPSRILDNYEHFVTKVKEISNSDLLALCDGIYRLIVVDIALERDTDDPQLIFESLNSTGLELSKADLIRNYLLMGLEPDVQQQIYEGHWRRMEILFGQKAYSEQFDNFIRDYLTVKTDAIPKKDRVYHDFKKYTRPVIQEQGIERVVTDIGKFARHYYFLVLAQETNSTLTIALADLRDLKTDVVYPFLLKVYDDYSTDILSLDDLIKIVKLVESYIFRRWVCGLSSRSYNYIFRDLLKAIDKENYLESVLAHFLLLPNSNRFPADAEFIEDIKERNLYNTRYRHYWLYRFENYNKKERISKSEGKYTIEHIMPQTENLSDGWKRSLGDDHWKDIHQKWLHTLGNLTLTGYNTEYGNKNFAEKRDMVGGFHESTLRLNKGLKDVEVWNEQAIKNRANRLAQEASSIWIYPFLSDEVIDKYRPKTQSDGNIFTIADHPFLVREGITKKLFDEFRRKVKGIDPCVTEEFLKIYIAYKAETNFVDVIPRAKHLCLSLNIGIDDIRDPKNIAIDVTGKGRWGNGDVEVHLHDSDEMSYIIDLVQQAFDKQIENGNYTV